MVHRSGENSPKADCLSPLLLKSKDVAPRYTLMSEDFDTSPVKVSEIHNASKCHDIEGYKICSLFIVHG